MLNTIRKPLGNRRFSMTLRLPRFRLEYEKSLTEALTRLGMGVAFSGQANFGRMLAGGSQGASISGVKHKTFLEVNEEGAEAAAATSVGIVTTSLPQVVMVDRPFLFLIRSFVKNRRAPSSLSAS